ncbi:MAG TPA: ATP-binding cassette domain-containing protein, partial [Candidatus Tenderia sp.]|nr:ATP-binding cassette domain-containing protein [Candidatus Tenderia sp.]
MPDLIVRARGLSKRYGDKAVVDGIDLSIERGQCFGLLGPNGAGKTTTLKMLLGNTSPSAGELTVLGLSVPAQARRMRERLGIVPQFDNLDPDFSVVENLRTYGSFFGIKRREMDARLPALLAFAALEGKADASISELS